MKPRLLAAIFCLCFALFGCSKKSGSGDSSSTGGDVAAPSSSGDNASAAGSTPSSANPSAGNAASGSASGGSASSTAKNVAAEVKPLVVPVGTVLTVNLGEAVGSKISQPGQAFSATLVEPVKVGGETVIAKGREGIWHRGGCETARQIQGRCSSAIEAEFYFRSPRGNLLSDSHTNRQRKALRDTDWRRRRVGRLDWRPGWRRQRRSNRRSCRCRRGHCWNCVYR